MEGTGKKPDSMKWGVIVLGILLAGAIVAFIFTTNSMSKKIEQAEIANEQLQLSNEYQALNTEFAQYENQSQLLANDSLVSKYAAAKSKVEKLLQELNSEKQKSAQRIKQLQDEIGTLKNILRHYVAQIDSLGKENASLRTENEQIKQRNQQLTTRVANETKRVEALSERMVLAEKLNVTGLSLNALKKNGKNGQPICRPFFV